MMAFAQYVDPDGIEHKSILNTFTQKMESSL